MAYKFIGRIKKIGIDPTGNFCEFSVDNNIKIDGTIYGVAFNEKHELKIIDTFKKIDSNVFNLLLSSQNEKMEIEFDNLNSFPIKNPQIDTDSKVIDAVSLFNSTIVKVTIIK